MLVGGNKCLTCRSFCLGCGSFVRLRGNKMMGERYKTSGGGRIVARGREECRVRKKVLDGRAGWHILRGVGLASSLTL